MLTTFISQVIYLGVAFTTLIPKCSDPVDFSDYRLISLIGCVYKILSKMLADRLAMVIHKVVSPSQTGFIAGRQILDGVLIANELIKLAKYNGSKMLLFKVDFEKAFDSVNWDFLVDIMVQMGFGFKWCNRIRNCLSSASVSILINGSPSNELQMKRGLRQGDPLSPFLFLLVAKALQVTMVDACNKGIFKGFSLGNNDLCIPLLQYADDALFFGDWSFSNIKALARILKCFQDASGLRVNFSKSKLYGVGVPLIEVEHMSQSIFCRHGSQLGRT